MSEIVVIDDEPMICEVVENILNAEGAEVHCALVGDKGLELLTSRRFDLALIDMIMPGVSGVALAEVAANRNTPALLMTGHPDATSEAVRFGFPHLAKPFRIQELIDETKRVMAEAHENIRLVKEAVARTRAAADGLKAAIADAVPIVERSRQFVSEIATRPASYGVTKVFIFASDSVAGTSAFTSDVTGGNLPVKYAPWRPINNGNAMVAGSDTDAAQAVIRDGYFLIQR